MSLSEMPTGPSRVADPGVDPVDDLGLRDDRLRDLAARVILGQRLDRADGLLLATTGDLLGIGRLADLVRRRLHGNRTFFNLNRHLNPTNVCVAPCPLCAFYVPWRRRDEGWTYSVEQAIAVIEQDVDVSVSELHIVGGLHPQLKVDYYEELFRALKVIGKTPVRMVTYPGEGHGNRRGASRYDLMVRLVRWMEHYLQGPGGDLPPAEVDYRSERDGWEAVEPEAAPSTP
jgi:hypothetical protein